MMTAREKEILFRRMSLLKCRIPADEARKRSICSICLKPVIDELVDTIDHAHRKCSVEADLAEQALTPELVLSLLNYQPFRDDLADFLSEIFGQNGWTGFLKRKPNGGYVAIKFHHTNALDDDIMDELSEVELKVAMNEKFVGIWFVAAYWVRPNGFTLQEDEVLLP